MGGTPEEDGMDEHRILAYIDTKCFRTPSANSLNGGDVST